MSAQKKKNKKNSYYHILSNYCSKNQIEIQEIKDYFKYSEKGLETFLNRSIEDVHKVTAQRNLKKFFISLYAGFNIPLEEFGFNSEDILSENYRKKHQKIWSSLEFFQHLKVGNSTSGPKDNLRTSYSNTLTRYISQAEDEIWVYDYYVSDAKNDLHYREAHEGHYKSIEVQLKKNKAAIYHRLLAFPYGFAKQDEYDLEQSTISAIKMCSYFTFEHIVNCFLNFDDRFYLSIATIPYRLYSYAILDQKFILTEYLRYKSDLTPIPDLLFVNRVIEGGYLDEVRDIYLNEIKLHETNNKIEKMAFVSTTETAFKEIEEKYLETKEKVKKKEPLDFHQAQQWPVLEEKMKDITDKYNLLKRVLLRNG